MVLSCWLGVARAQTVTVDVDEAKASALGLDPADLEGQLAALIDDQLYTTDNDWYMSKYANAAAMAIKGMGVDYASNPKKFVVGASLGPAVSGVPFSLSRGPESLPDGGFAFMAAGMVGVNLGLLDGGQQTPLDHVVIYANGMAFNPPANKAFQASMFNVGGHLQLSFGGPVKIGGVAEWGGIALTGGVDLSSYHLSLQQELPLEQDVDPAKVKWTATGTYDLGSTTTTFPLEVSTNLRVAVVTPFVGGGVDLNTANAGSDANLSGPIDATAAGQTENIGSASVTLSGAGSADPVAPRLFGGLQLGLSAFKIYGQLNYGFNQTYGGHVGVRVAM